MKLISTTTQALNQIAQNPGGIYSAPEIVPQCSLKSLPIQNKQGKFITSYQGRLVLPSEYPSKSNKLNIEVFSVWKLPDYAQSVRGGQTEWAY